MEPRDEVTSPDVSRADEAAPYRDDPRGEASADQGEHNDPSDDPSGVAGSVPARLQAKVDEFEGWARSRQTVSQGVAALLVGLVVALVTLAGPPIFTSVKDWWAERTSDALTITTTLNQDKVEINGTKLQGEYVIPRFPGDLEAPPADTDGDPNVSSACLVSYDRAMEQGGVVADVMLVDVVMEIQSSKTVSLTSMDVVQDAREQDPPLSGSLPSCGRGAGGGEVPILEVSLARDPDATASKLVTPDGEPTSLPSGLKKGDVFHFIVRAKANNCFCRWSVALNGVRGGEKFTQPVDDAGDPFETTSSGKAVMVFADGEQWTTGAPPVVLAPPPAGVDLPELNTCTLLTADDWSRTLRLAVQQSRVDINGVWTRANLVPGLPPQASSRCGFIIGDPDVEEQNYAFVTAVRAQSAEDARVVASDFRFRNAISPWRMVRRGVYTNGTDELILLRGSDVISASFVLPNLSAAEVLDTALPRLRRAFTQVPR